MEQRSTIDFETAPRSDDAPTLARAVLSILEHAKHELEWDLRAAEAHIHEASSLLQVEIDRRVRGTAPAVACGGLAGWQVRRLKAYVDRHLGTTICVKDLSDLVHLSATYFCRTFKKSFGETVHAYVIGRRLDYAGHLMLASDTPLCEIALACGFSDQAHLSKLFRRRMGDSPGKWRRERRASATVSQRLDEDSEPAERWDGTIPPPTGPVKGPRSATRAAGPWASV
jgi:AraC family transcriptional regulator